MHEETYTSIGTTFHKSDQSSTRCQLHAYFFFFQFSFQNILEHSGTHIYIYEQYVERCVSQLFQMHFIDCMECRIYVSIDYNCNAFSCKSNVSKIFTNVSKNIYKHRYLLLFTNQIKVVRNVNYTRIFFQFSFQSILEHIYI